MSEEKKTVELSGDIDFIETPPAKASQFETGEDCGIEVTKVSLPPSRC
jgi:cyclopropane-fatty-acyl-phospholipid synthase